MKILSCHWFWYFVGFGIWFVFNVLYCCWVFCLFLCFLVCVFVWGFSCIDVYVCMCMFCLHWCVCVCVCVLSYLNVAIFVFDSILVTIVVCNSIYFKTNRQKTNDSETQAPSIMQDDFRYTGRETVPAPLNVIHWVEITQLPEYVHVHHVHHWMVLWWRSVLQENHHQYIYIYI